jgi:NADPH:quinone reductase-like Zn-dependent oxidoreductase
MMGSMKAVVIPAIGQLELRDVSAPPLHDGEVRVRLRAAALNHRDVWIRKGQYAGLKYPCIVGSDGAGVISDRASNVDAAWVGKEVIINPSFNWGDSPKAQGKTFSILGLPRDGTLAQEIAVPVDQVAPKPDYLTWEEAAALPLAGLTAYRAVFSRANVRAGERVLVSGVGGGVATFALQFAVAAGASVWVTSSSAEKIERARKLGAQAGFDYREADWAKKAQESAGPFDVIVDSAGGKGFINLVDAAAPGGRIVFFGATQGDPETLPMRKIFWKQLNLLGTTMGNPADWTNLVKFVTQHKIRPVISGVFSFDEARAAFDLMERGGQFGKIVLKISN